MSIKRIFRRFTTVPRRSDKIQCRNRKSENDLKLARQQLKELPNAGWMILNRDYHYTSIMFKNTVSQMQSIGSILPLLFYLVAALVCMTTMKRLIDEQRGQIGIFRALGFSKGQIIENM